MALGAANCTYGAFQGQEWQFTGHRIGIEIRCEIEYRRYWPTGKGIVMTSPL